MPYDATKTRGLLKMAGAYSGHPQGEMVAQMGIQLQAAEDEILASGRRAADAELKLDRMEKEVQRLEARVLELRSQVLSQPPKTSDESCI